MLSRHAPLVLGGLTNLTKYPSTPRLCRVHLYNRSGSSGNTVGALAATCDDCGPCGTRTVLTVPLSAGNYFVVMDGYSTGSGVYRLNVSCPNTAIIQQSTSCGATVTGNTSTGTHVVGSGSAPEHYFSFTAPYSGIFTFNSCGTSFDS